VNSEDKDGRTPLSWAMQEKAMIQPVGFSQVSNHALPDYQMQLMLLEQQNKKRLMMRRQQQGCIPHEAVVKLLLAKDGVNVNSKDKDGQTPLSWAENGHKEVAKLLTIPSP
jgi:ankyrin repeat protein